MYDELVERLRNKAETERWLLPHSDNGTAAILEEAADAIEELRRSEAVALVNCADEHNRRLKIEHRYRWIPVEERRPKHGMDILICYEWTGRSGTVYRQVGIASIEELEYRGYRPIAWMPLPEPPEEDDTAFFTSGHLHLGYAEEGEGC